MADVEGAPLTPPAHGGLVADELTALGLVVDDILDLSVNVNPYGPCPSVMQAILDAPVHRYPDPTAAPARRALAHSLDVAPARIVLGNGAVDLFWTLARVTLRPGDGVLVVEPAFSELRAAAVWCQARVSEHRTLPERDFALDLGALDAALRATRPRLCYVASPSNPAGVCTPVSDLAALAVRHPETLFVVDLSFASLGARHADLDRPLSPSVVWARSLTKDHALAGLRVGYVLAPEALAAALERARPPWSVNGLAQAAAIATTAAPARAFVDASRARLIADRRSMVSALIAAGLRVHPSDTVYALVDLGPRLRATALRDALLRRHRVLVRDCTSFGLPHHIRVAARPSGERARLLTALERETHR